MKRFVFIFTLTLSAGCSAGLLSPRSERTAAVGEGTIDQSMHVQLGLINGTLDSVREFVAGVKKKIDNTKQQAIDGRSEAAVSAESMKQRLTRMGLIGGGGFVASAISVIVGLRKLGFRIVGEKA